MHTIIVLEVLKEELRWQTGVYEVFRAGMYRRKYVQC